MCNATIPIDDVRFEAYNRLAAELGVSFEDWALSVMEEAFEEHELAKVADEAYRDYLADPVTYTLEEVIRMNGDDDLLGDA